MMNKAGFIVGVVLGIIGLYKIDMFLIPTLDYFGKYVFFGLINFFIVYLYYVAYKKFWYVSVLIGTLLLIFSFIIGV